MKTQKNVMKCWPGIKKIGVDTNTTKYKFVLIINKYKKKHAIMYCMFHAKTK